MALQANFHKKSPFHTVFVFLQIEKMGLYRNGVYPKKRSLSFLALARRWVKSCARAFFVTDVTMMLVARSVADKSTRAVAVSLPTRGTAIFWLRKKRKEPEKKNSNEWLSAISRIPTKLLTKGKKFLESSSFSVTKVAKIMWTLNSRITLQQNMIAVARKKRIIKSRLPDFEATDDQVEKRLFSIFFTLAVRSIEIEL